MKKARLLIALITVLTASFSAFSQNCSKSILLQNGTPGKENYSGETKRLVFDQPSLTKHADIYFGTRDQRMYVGFEITLNRLVEISDSTQVDIRFENGQTATLYSSNFSSSEVGTTVLHRFECLITSRDYLDMFFLIQITDIKFGFDRTGSNVNHKNGKKCLQLFKCLADRTDFAEMIYTPK